MKPSLRSKARRLLNWLRMLPLILAGIVTACGGSLDATQHTERETCLAAALAEMNLRADRECPGDWDTCPSRGDIMAGLAALQRGCPHAR
jgi:hypothetical protein